MAKTLEIKNSSKATKIIGKRNHFWFYVSLLELLVPSGVVLYGARIGVNGSTRQIDSLKCEKCKKIHKMKKKHQLNE